MATITTINSSDQVSNSRSVINTNFSNLNSDKVETLADLGVTASAAELNVLDGISASTAELNYTDGVTSAIQTQIDSKFNSSNIKIIYKSADEIVNNSTTLQDDNELIIPVLANEVWSFSATLYATSSATAELKIGFSVPSGTTMWFNDDDYLWRPSYTEGQTIVNSLSTGTIEDGIIHGVIFVGETPGNVVLQWAQTVADVYDTRLRKGSHIIAHKLA